MGVGVGRQWGREKNSLGRKLTLVNGRRGCVGGVGGGGGARISSTSGKFSLGVLQNSENSTPPPPPQATALYSYLARLNSTRTFANDCIIAKYKSTCLFNFDKLCK